MRQGSPAGLKMAVVRALRYKRRRNAAVAVEACMQDLLLATLLA
jgi:hypothetical protein